MNRIPFLARLLTLTSLFLAAALWNPAPIRAQYMYIDTNGDGVHTSADVVKPNEPTTIAVWLDTQHDRDGSLQSCNSHTGAPHTWEGPPPDPGLSIFSYNFRLLADQGTIVWGEFADNLGFEQLSPDLSIPSEFHVQRNADLGDELPPGLYKLGEMTATVQYGTPAIRFGLMSEIGAGEMTQFGTYCSGSEYRATYLYGVDWFDAYGLSYEGTIGGGGAVQHVPVLAQPAAVTVVENHPVDVSLTASDVDGQPLSFSKLSGAACAEVSTLDPGVGQATGRIHVAPLGADVGFGSIVVRVTDGEFSCDRAVTLSILRELELPAQPPRSMLAGTRVKQTLFASNPLNQNVTYYLASGPSFVTVLTMPALQGVLSMAPSQQDIGTWAATIGVRNGTLHDEKSFTIEVLRDGINHPPVAALTGPLFGIVGRPLQLDGSKSSDPDGDRLSYTWNFGDGESDGSGPRVLHRYSAVGEYAVDLIVRDPEFYMLTTATARISEFAPARAHTAGGGAAILVAGVEPDLRVRVEPQAGLFACRDLDPASVTLAATRTRGIDPIGRITAIGFDPGPDTDSDRNGIEDKGLLFAGRDVADLLRGTGGRKVDLVVAGNLAGGGRFLAPLEITVVRKGGPLSAAIAPNPMNPLGELSFVTSRAGTADVRVFDVSGRLARHAIDRQVIPAGFHRIALDGRGDQGEVLPSGIYYYVIETPEGRARGRFAIVR